MRSRPFVGLIALIVAVLGTEHAAAAEPRIHSLLARGDFAAAEERVDKRIAGRREANQVNSDGASTLHVAARYGADGIVTALLDSGIDVDLPDDSGRSALAVAASREQHGIVDLLLARGAAVGRTDLLGLTPLMYAAASGNAAMVSKLLAAGADADARDSLGADALMHAADSRLAGPEVYDLLLAGGARADTIDARGQSALYLARANGDPALVQRLISRGVSFALVDLLFDRTQLQYDGYYFGVQFEEPNGSCEDPRFTGVRPRILRTAIRYPAWSDALDCQRLYADGRIHCQLDGACEGRDPDAAYQQRVDERSPSLLAEEVRETDANVAIVYTDPRYPGLTMQFAQEPGSRGASTRVPAGSVDVMIGLYAVDGQMEALADANNFSEMQEVIEAIAYQPPMVRMASTLARQSSFRLVEQRVRFTAEADRSYKILARFRSDESSGSVTCDIWAVDFETSEIVFESRNNPLSV